jgi:conjugal transfer mating pair stabilization protein TraN
MGSHENVCRTLCTALILVAAGTHLAFAALTGVVCGQDLDGDGLIEEPAGELLSCLGGFCSLGAVDCTPTYAPPVCAEEGALDPVRDVCQVEPLARVPVVVCPPDYNYVPAPLDRCEAPVPCAAGTYSPAEDSCYLGNLTCPLGGYACGNSGAGRNQCSPNPCVDLAAQPPVDTEADRTAYEADGTIDPATGTCSGLFLIFNGKPSECLPPGYQTTWFDCCDTDRDRFLFLEEHCGEEALETAAARVDERVVSVGSYCKKRLRFIGCIQRAEVYCVFTSKLGRIIQEQGRPQLTAFGLDGGWGTAENPRCEGFAPEAFQALDFSQIDFSEFFGDLATPPPEAVQTEMQEKIDAFYDRL